MATQKIVRTYSSGIELRLKVLRVLLEIKRETMAEILWTCNIFVDIFYRLSCSHFLFFKFSR